MDRFSNGVDKSSDAGGINKYMLTPRERIIRRLLHAAFGGIILYYVMPTTIFSIPKWVLLIVLFSVPTIIMESWRLTHKKAFFGMREHERYHVASYFWMINGSVILLLIFPQFIAAPCILAAAIGDPVIGETRWFRRRLSFSIGILTCVAIFVLFRYPLPIAILVGIITFLAESLNVEIIWEFREELFYSRSRRKVSRRKELFDFIFKTDDDFMMQVVPAVVIYVMMLIFSANGWTWLMPPDNLLNPLPDLMPFA